MIRRLFLFVYLAASASSAAPPRACVGSQPLGTFKLSVLPAKGGQTLPLSELNALRKGEYLVYEPVHIPPAARSKAEIALLLAPAAKSQAPLEALKPEPAAKQAVWQLPRDASVVALVYGPQGLSMRKVKQLMEKNDEVLSELADYASETAQVSQLIQTLQESEASGGSISAALAGFSAKSGVTMPAIDVHTATSQQAVALLHALQPSLSSLDPLTGSSQSVTQQTTGLATAVAGLFFGNMVGLAAGGVSLFTNMSAMLFPDTEFRSVVAQANAGGFALCAKSAAAKARTRPAYLWAYRMPELAIPKLSLQTAAHLPVGSKSLINVHADGAAKELARLHDWQLTPVKGTDVVHVPAGLTKKDGEVELDLSKVKAAPGEYRLQAFWDWDDLAVAGDVYLHPYGDLKSAKLAAGSAGKLVEGGGKVPVKLEGTDFEFIDKVSLEKTGAHADAPVTLAFNLPHGKRAGVQESLEADLNTNGLAPGNYKLLLAQSDGPAHPIDVTVLPPNPKIEDLPLRLNLDESGQKLVLHGSGLERIVKITMDAGEVELAAPSKASAKREAVFKLNSKAKKGARLELRLQVEGLDAPLEMADAVEIQGPRPRISKVRTSYPQNLGLALAPDEIPAAVTASFALAVAHAGDAPVVEVTCTEAGALRHALRLAAGDRSGGARLDLAGEGILFLSFEPGTVGRSGCRLEARATSPDGVSDPCTLGRILRVPRIEQFEMTDQKLGDAVYAGTLKGEDLDTIERAGWDAQHGLAVESIPDAIPGEPQKQLLKIALPWPAPAPHAPVFVWLRGEAAGRATGVKY